MSRHIRQKACKLKLDILRVADSKTKETLITILGDQLDSLPAEDDPEAAWDNCRNTVYDSAKQRGKSRDNLTATIQRSPANTNRSKKPTTTGSMTGCQHPSMIPSGASEGRSRL